MADRLGLLTAIGRRIAHIHFQVDLGAPRGDKIFEQHKTLLILFSQLRCLDEATAARINKDLFTYGGFSNEQLIAFTASLAAAFSDKRDKHTTLPMQNLDALEHCFLQSDWDQLVKLGSNRSKPATPSKTFWQSGCIVWGLCVRMQILWKKQVL